MKKIITTITMVIVFSLGANETMCQMSTDSYLKSEKLLGFAYERKNVFQIKWHTNNALRSLERAMVECDLNETQIEEANKQRKKLMNILEAISKAS